MKVRSAKAKGQRAAKELKDILLKRYPQLTEDDIRVTPSGVNGPDLHLSPAAKEYLPFSFEVKNQEKLNVWEALSQAQSHIKDDEIAALVFKRNRSRTYITMLLDDFLELTA